MPAFIRLVTLLMVLVPFSAAAQPSTALFGATGSNGVDANLYSIDPNTGASTLIGPVLVGGQNVELTGLAVSPRTRVLFGVTSGEGGFPGHLLTIDKVTAVGTVVGPLGIPTTNCAGNAVGIVADIAFSAINVLFGVGPCGPSSAGNLYTISTTTGAATPVGAVNFPGGNRRGFGLSFLPLTLSPQQPGPQQLFVFPQATDQNMYVIDPASGGILQTIGLVGGNSDAINAATGDPSGTLLLGVKTNRSESPTTNSLVAIHPVTGLITVRGPLPADMDALALEPPAPSASIPTLGEWGQVLVVGFLVGSALWMIRRRRRASA